MSEMEFYTSARAEVSKPADLSDPAVRKQLSRDAVLAFMAIMAHWKIRGEDAQMLLGGISNGAFYDLKKKENPVLEEDRLRRISYLIGIFNALNTLFDEDLADDWIKMPNKNPVFNRKTPLDYLLHGGMPAFMTLRKLLDGRRDNF
jgi:uncharacterized protein (DUF2384 family)